MFIFEVDTSSFIEYMDELHWRFLEMVQTMMDVAELVKANTLPLTPRETGRLGESFRYVVWDANPDFIEVEVKMDAVDPRDGYRYAEYQHETFGLHHQYGQMWFLKAGIYASRGMAFEMIEKDYLSLFNEGFSGL